MTEGTPARRGSHVQMPAAYAAVGASKQADVVRFPPAGSTAYEESLRLGSGQPRFLIASSALMTWAAQLGAGMQVEHLGGADAQTYAGPEFGADGTPVAPAHPEEKFAADGTPYIAAGNRVRVTFEKNATRELLVVYTVDEPRRAGFAWGTVDTNGPVGEQLFVVEHRDDDSVWAVARGFLEASKDGLFGRKGKQDLQAALNSIVPQLRGLLPGAAQSRSGDESDPTPEAS
ncbi:DUF1990 family protein [Leucobacter sp. HY1910]